MGLEIRLYMVTIDDRLLGSLVRAWQAKYISLDIFHSANVQYLRRNTSGILLIASKRPASKLCRQRLQLSFIHAVFHRRGSVFVALTLGERVHVVRETNLAQRNQGERHNGNGCGVGGE